MANSSCMDATRDATRLNTFMVASSNDMPVGMVQSMIQPSVSASNKRHRGSSAAKESADPVTEGCCGQKKCTIF